MDSTCYGSFSIACRLASALKLQTVPEKRARTIASFMARYSAEPRHIAQLLRLLLCHPGTCVKAEEVVAHVAEVASIENLVYATHGTLPIEDAVDFAAELCVAGARGSGAAAMLHPSTIARVASCCEAKEFRQLLAVAAGKTAAVIGDTKPSELLAVLGDTAVACFEASGDVAAAVAVAMDGSPRAIVEAQPSFVEAADDTGYATPPPEQRADGSVRDGATPMLFRRDSSTHIAATPSATAPTAADIVVSPADDGLAAKAVRTDPPACKYGSGCVRKNPQHFLEFSHPPGHPRGGAGPRSSAAPPPAPPTPTPPAAAPMVPPTGAPAPTVLTDVADPRLPALPLASTQAINGVEPLRAMPEYEFIYVDGGSPATGGHKIKNCGGGTFTCSCPVWRFQNRATNARTCKHLRGYLGDAYERERCGADVVPGGAEGASRPPSAHPLVAKKHPLAGVLLAESANKTLGYEGWWMSEKLDGVRAYWNGAVLLSRNGNELTAPDWFTAPLPRGISLDGELFGGRQQFQKTVGVVKSSAAHPGWKGLTYEVFDVPSSGAQPFEDRLRELERLLAGAPPHVHLVAHRKCTGKADLDAELAAVTGSGGEGLMLRQPGSSYVPKRSSTLLKVKLMQDIDAIVRGYDRGKGRNEGRVGALIAELANGKQFNCGSGLSDAQRNAPPPVGTVIVVRAQGLTDGGVPRFPVFAGCRYDIDWPPATGGQK